MRRRHRNACPPVVARDGSRCVVHMKGRFGGVNAACLPEAADLMER